MTGEGKKKSKGRAKPQQVICIVDAQEFALYASGKEKLKSAEGVLEAVISVRTTAKVHAQG